MSAGTWLGIATAVFLAGRAESEEAADHAAAGSADSAADIARKLNNPIASLISDDKPSGGPDWGLRFTMTFAFPK